MNSLIRIWIGLMLLLMTALDAEGAEVSPIAILCPCSFEPQNQTYGLAKFSVVFNDPVAASGAVNVEFAMFKDLDFSNWSLLSSAEINSLAYKAAPQAVEVRLPTYAYSEPATGFAGLRITNTTDFNFYDGVLLSTSSSTRQKVYGLSSVNSLPMMFLTPPEFSATVDSATLTVSKLYTPALANETDSFDVLVTVGKGAESFFIKGTTLATVSYDADGIAQLQVTIPLSDALDNHLNQDGSKTDVQIRIKRGETQILSYWVDSLAADGVAPSIGAVITAPDTLKDTDGDGISDFNEALLGSDPRIQDLVDQVNIELVYTYGKTAKDQYGDELDARLILLHEAAKAVFSASGVPVNLVELQRVDVGDESGMSAEDVIAQMEQRTGLFADFDAKLDRKPDLIIHFGLEEVLDTGGLANLQGGLADGIIASASAYASGLNVGVVGVDGVDELTLPHEIGHLMGLVHSKAQGEADGAFPWSRGHGVNGDFVTTMGYSTAFEDAPALGYFSSPSLKCGGSGLPCGIARSDYVSGADAVLTLQTTAHQIAAISNGFSPVLTIIGDNPATVTSEAAILELTATATDAEDGSLTTKIKATVAAAPAGSQGFTHVQTFSVEDADRNTQSAVRKINLVEQAADSDNDGVVDEQDAFPIDSSETADTDKDGVGDNADAFPNDATETLDTDDDGVGDNKDAFPNNPAESSDTDGDKVGDKADAFPTNSAETVDTDGDGTGNNADLDDDDDGFPDAEEVAAGTDPLSASSCPGCFSFDIDDDGEAKALTDGLLVIRHLFGFSGEALTAGAVGSDAKRSTPADIAAYLTNAATELDIDGDDEAKALTDGLLLIRQLFGFTGNALTAGAVGEAAERATASAIQAYIAQRLPDSNGSASGSDDGGGVGSDTGDAGGSGTDGSDTGVDSGGGSTSGGSTDGGTSDGGTDSGGDSGDSGGPDGGSAGTKTIEIDVVYDRVPYCTSASCGSLGLDYAKTVQKPVRFAKGAVLDADSKQVLMDNLRTDAAGRVSFSVAVDQAFIVRVYAESSGDGAASWGLRIVDNNGADQEGTYPLYVLESGAINANAVTEPVTLQAESGWGLTKYTQTRSAAPFAILDSMISATLYALSGRSTLVFAPVDVYWSVANTLDSVGTSYYSGSYIMILGDAEVDTDEYDESVIVHEWGHYFQSILSKDDSVGGSHGGGDLLDMRVAFSEGWANAYSGLATARDAYIDTSGSQQAGGFGILLEAELSEGQGAVKGWYSEDSAQYLVYDLFDDGALDDDNLALPVSAMMASLIDFMPQQAAATSIFSFSAGVIDAQPNQSGSIMALLDREDIGRGSVQIDSLGSGEANSASEYAAVENIEAMTLPVYTVLDSSLVSAEMCQDVLPASAPRVFGIDNKLGAYRFAQFEISQTGNYTVRLTTTAKPLGAASDPDFGVYNAQGLIGPQLNELTADVDLESHNLRLVKGQYWTWAQDYNNYQRGGNSGRYCQRLEVVPQ